ncbi:MAG: rhodanese-like domain-containing protein [Alphaproteobacteria bacterium]|nr:MAG: rhodanese-like domain-containing protein [Alphaproteobacteria bacterium]
MKKILSLIAFVVVAVTLNFVMADSIPTVKPLEVQKMQQEKNAIIVDVRELDEQSSGMAKDAISLPLSTMKDKKEEWEKIVATFPKDKTVVIYCKSGRRAGIVGEELVKKGFKVLNMESFDSWQNAGLPILKK